MEDIESHSGTLLRDPRTRPTTNGLSTTFAFDSRHVLYGKLRPYLNKVAALDFAGRCTTEFIPLLPLKEVDRDFLAWAMRRPETVAAAMKEKTGSRMPRADMNDLLALRVPLPSLPEQRRIAATLHKKTDAARQAIQHATAQRNAAKLLGASYARKALLSEEAADWPRSPLGDLVDNHDGKRVPVRVEDRRTMKGPYPYYGASGIIDHVNRFLFEGDFLLIAEDGANLLLRSTPVAFPASGRFWVNNHAHIVQPRPPLTIDYFLHFFSILDLKPFVTGAAQPKLTQEDMNRIPVPVPPSNKLPELMHHLREQTALAATLRAYLDDQITALRALPASLLREAFRGRL